MLAFMAIAATQRLQVTESKGAGRHESRLSLPRSARLVVFWSGRIASLASGANPIRFVSSPIGFAICRTTGLIATAAESGMPLLSPSGADHSADGPPQKND
jgi:hypothetical protein